MLMNEMVDDGVVEGNHEWAFPHVPHVIERNVVMILVVDMIVCEE